jgi:cytochrome b561
MTTWIVLRAAGIGAYVMLFLSVSWGLIATTGVLGKRVSKATATSVHQFMSTAGLLLLAVHIGGLLVDAFMPFGPGDVLIPGRSSFEPVPVAFGIVAMYSMVFVIVLSWLRKRIGTTWWRRSHLLAAPTFILSMIHGVFSGTDSVRPAMWWTYASTGVMVLFLVVLRGLTVGFRPPRAAASSPARRPTTRSATSEPVTSTL